MSGTPKYHDVRVERERQARLEQERRRKAEEEARSRRKAEERERQRRLEAVRGHLTAGAQSVIAQVWEKRGEAYAQDGAGLQQRCDALLASLRAGWTESQLREAAQEAPRIDADLGAAIARKRRDDGERQRRAELDRQHFALSEVERQASTMSTPDVKKFDAPGGSALVQAIATAKTALFSGDPSGARAPLARAEQALQVHRDTVTQRRAEWERRRAVAEQAIGDLRALIAGLEADEIVLRWRPQPLAELKTAARKAAEALVDERFEIPGTLLAAARSQAQAMVEEANAAQLRADQRDYIARCIAATLQEMGFVVGKPQEEHSGHPATALVLNAAAGSGKSIAVSVPVEGQVWYTVDGYPKTSEALTGGGSAPACDEAEAVLDDMRVRLLAEFGVQSGEILWEGKADPSRVLAQKEQMRSAGEQGRGVSR